MNISVMLVRALVGAVEQAGFDRTKFLVDAGLEGVQLDDILGRIPVDAYHHAVRVAYETSADPAFGLHVGERLRMGTFDVLGHLTEHSASLRDAIDVVLRYSGFVSEGPRVRFEEHGDSATFSIILPENESLTALLAAEFSMVTLLRLLRSFAGEAALPKHVYFVHAKPAHAHEYTRCFDARECFSHEFTGIEFDRAWLDHAPACRETELRDYLLKRAELLLAKAERNVSTAERVRRWLAAQPELSRPTLESAAGDLGMSTRTLRRHLREDKVQFSVLVDGARIEHAKRTLSEPGRSIEETAYALGFRTPSAFSRAFKRWTGMTPRAYRSAPVAHADH